MEGWALADSEGQRCGEARRDSERSEERASGGGSMGDSDSIILQRELSLRVGSVGRRIEAGQHQGSGNGAEQQRAVESRLGGNPYELSDWLDGWGMNPLDALVKFISSYPQPAPRGIEQYSWEPHRVATGVKNREPRLRALGNAVDPLQALPVLYGIRVINDFLERIDSYG